MHATNTTPFEHLHSCINALVGYEPGRPSRLEKATAPGSYDLLMKSASALQPPFLRVQRRDLEDIYRDARESLSASIGTVPSSEIAKAEALLARIGSRLFAMS
jgi:hypothetical protein